MFLTLIGALAGLVAGVMSTVALYRATLRSSELEWRTDHSQVAAEPSSTGAPPAK
jgi:hypothetical protein